MKQPRYDVRTGRVVDAALAVHRAIGPGMLESVYQTCLAFELRERGIPLQVERDLPVRYRGVEIDAGFRIDMLVDNAVVVELKTVSKLLPVHEAQLLSYLRMSGHQIGLLINFNVPLLRDGIKRLIDEQYQQTARSNATAETQRCRELPST